MLAKEDAMSWNCQRGRVATRVGESHALGMESNAGQNIEKRVNSMRASEGGRSPQGILERVVSGKSLAVGEGRINK